ncbi:hypothetical protein [Sorangium sp. So ce1389]|uniref:hypothetical protein n=1 Tax=Sorangium sp. So ce1389 TaxID=3133336 RepID=UPI003F640097
MSEVLVSRIAGAVRFISAVSRRPVTGRLLLSSDKAIEWRRNRSGDYVVWRAEGLDAYTGHDPALTPDELNDLFDAPPGASAPESLSFDVTVEDPGREFIARRFLLRLPRRATAAAGAEPDVFLPVEVTMYPAPGAQGAGHGAELYVLVHDGRGRDGALPGALVTVTIDDAEVGRGVTGAAGEALVVLPTLARFSVSQGNGAIVVSEQQARVQASVLPALLEQKDGLWTQKRAPDPEHDFSRAVATSAPGHVQIAAGRAVSYSLAVNMA